MGLPWKPRRAESGRGSLAPLARCRAVPGLPILRSSPCPLFRCRSAMAPPLARGRESAGRGASPRSIAGRRPRRTRGPPPAERARGRAPLCRGGRRPVVVGRCGRNVKHVLEAPPSETGVIRSAAQGSPGGDPPHNPTPPHSAALPPAGPVCRGCTFRAGRITSFALKFGSRRNKTFEEYSSPGKLAHLVPPPPRGL